MVLKRPWTLFFPGMHSAQALLSAGPATRANNANPVWGPGYPDYVIPTYLRGSWGLLLQLGVPPLLAGSAANDGPGGP